jgi:hypothetical protein
MTEGALKKNEIGRWEFSNCELRSGDAVEVFVGQWITGRIEHDSRDYYLLAGDETTVIRLREGMRARLPRVARPRFRP